MSMEDYANKKAAFDRVTAERTQIIARTHEIVKAMAQSPNLFHFANCEGGFPAEVALNRTAPTVSADEWPTAQKIQNVLSRWHAAKFAAETAWRALSPDQQKAMNPPI